MNGAELITMERQRQIEEEGWTPEHDEQHTKGELAIAGACYAFHYVGDTYQDEGCFQVAGDFWPWDAHWFKTTKWLNTERENYIRLLVKAGALIAAEIDRLQRRS